MRPGGLVYWVGSGKQGTKLAVAMSDGGHKLVDVVALVPADAPAVFAVHKAIMPRRGKPWQVSHVRSGRLVRIVRTRTLAVQLAEALAPLGDWNRPASRLPASLKKATKAVVKGMGL
jgi:hypothetical protein